MLIITKILTRPFKILILHSGTHDSVPEDKAATSLVRANYPYACNALAVYTAETFELDKLETDQA